MNRSTLFALGLTAALLGGACADTTEIDNKPAATVAEPAKEAPAPDAKPAAEAPAAKVMNPVEAKAPEGTKWTAAADASSINFLGAKVTATHRGGFKEFTGEAVSNDGKVSFVKFVVQTDSIWADAGGMSEKLTGHLKSPDFFNVTANPKAAFASTKIEYGDGNAATVTGNLMFVGQTKEISFPATIEMADDKVVATADFQINRKDWGLNYKGKPDDLIKDEVALDLDLTFTK